MTNIEKLEKLNLRDQWQTEDKDFTPWLSENLDLLSGEIKLDLELKGTNIPVGNYNAKILRSYSPYAKFSTGLTNFSSGIVKILRLWLYSQHV